MSQPNHAPDPAQMAHMLREVSGAQGFNAWLGVELLRCETGLVEIGFPIRPELTQHHGYVHGGIVATIADIVAAWTAASVVGDVVTSSFTIQFLSPAQGQHLRAVGAVLKAGKRQASIEVKVFAQADGQEPRLCAVALAAITPTGR